MVLSLSVLPSVGVLAKVAFETLRICVPTVAQAAAGTVTAEVCNDRLHSWSRRLVEDAKVHIEVEGLEHIVPDEAYVVMSNHQSHYDIPVLFQALPMPVRMVAKKELFKIPIFAHAMRVAGFVEIDRKNREQAIATLNSARQRLHENISIWIAPEGTRSRSGKLGAFKKGGFHLAVQAGLRILPIAIAGTREVLPADGLTVTKGKSVVVRVAPPIDPKSFADRFELVEAVRRAIIERLPREYYEDSPSAATEDRAQFH